MKDLSIYLIIMLVVYCTFLNIKLIFEFLKTIGRVEVLVVYLRREIGKNVIKYIHVYNVDI